MPVVDDQIYYAVCYWVCELRLVRGLCPLEEAIADEKEQKK